MTGQQETAATKDRPARALEVREVTYFFRQKRALSRVSFDVETGTIHGFVGPNGAGKTTTLKVISTLLPPLTGTVKVFGRDVRHDTLKVRRSIGYMPEHLGMYRQMTVFEYLDFFAAAYGLPLKGRDRTIWEVLKLTDMEGRRDDLISSLSRGMEQRVSLARVLVHDPRLLLLDEPASGLDPRARIELMEILRELCGMGKTILISSHILSELSALCHAVTVIDRETVRYSGSMKGLLEQGGNGNSYRLTLKSPVPSLEKTLSALPGIAGVSTEEDGGLILRFSAEADTRPLLRAVLDAGGEVVGFNPVRRQLDEAFMDLTEPGIRP